MSFGERLKYLREKKGMRQEDIGSVFNVGKSAVSQWENNIRIPEINIIKGIAQYFDVSLEYLFEMQVTPFKLPVLGFLHTAPSILAEENITGYLDVPPSIKADYILQVDDDSMIGVGILKGDYAICLKRETATSGQIVVVLEDKSAEYIETKLMFYYRRGNGPTLRPANPNYPEIHMTDNHHIVGIMVALIRQEVPGYQTYRDYLAIAGHDEWKEVIEAASLAGIKPGRLKSHVDMLIEMGKNSI